MVRRIVLLIVLNLLTGSGLCATIVATLDRNPVTANESFTVTFEAQGSVDDHPDFSPLETDFEILNQSQSSRMNFVNGRMDSTKQWQLVLMAPNPGHYTLPGIKFGKDSSNPLKLEVRDVPAAGAAPDNTLFLEVELTPESAYLQAQIVYTVRLLRSVNLRSASLSEPTISGVEAMVEKLGDDRSFETERNGVRYAVVERSYAIFPQQSGTLVVEPVVFRGQVLTRRGRSPFDNSIQSKRLKSKAFNIEIKPKPVQATAPWLPARALRLQEEWAEQPPRFRVGEPVTRTLTLAADGIAAAQLPSLTHTLPDGLKQYADQPALQDEKRSTGLFGIRQEKTAIMPSRPGRYELPAIEVPWWNVETGRQEIARVAARSIEVAAATDNQPAAATLPPVPRDVSPTTPEPQTLERGSAGLWPWLSVALALGWTITAALWWRQYRAPKPAVAAPKPAGDFKRVQKACQQNDARGCKTALLGWAQAQWPQQPPTSLGAIATRVDDAFATAIDGLNQVLYAREGSDWQGAELLAAAQHWRKTDQVGRLEPPSPIAPLRPY